MKSNLISIKRVFKSISIRSKLGFYRFYYKTKKRANLRRFSKENWEYGTSLLDANNVSSSWLFHDETWDYIVNRWDYRNRLMKGERLELRDVTQPMSPEVIIEKNGIVNIDCESSTNDEWIYLYLDYSKYNWLDYSCQFTIEFETSFKEFQVDFRHIDLFNRYRYRFQDAKLFFDIVHRGEFISSLSETDFDLKNNVSYDIEIKVMGDIFQIWIDGCLMSTDFGGNKIRSGPVAIIFWEDNGKSNIKAKMHDFSFRRLLIK